MKNYEQEVYCLLARIRVVTVRMIQITFTGTLVICALLWAQITDYVAFFATVALMNATFDACIIVMFTFARMRARSKTLKDKLNKKLIEFYQFVLVEDLD